MAITLRVNGATVTVSAGTTVLQACEAAGTEIPRFCYHERLRVAGNCRRCLVEVAGAPKPVASCAQPVRPNRTVWTETPLVRKARESVREFLLKNHPLDCPICDQGGECDLQDQSRVFGSDRARLGRLAPKRSAEDKERGPLVKTVRTRCIQCTRCVRFASEIAGVADLGATGRGEDVEIGTYLKQLWRSEIAGNVVDLCPVGALTAAPTAFRHRPWELRTVPSYDVGDSRLGAVQVGVRGNTVRRTQPRTDDAVNGEWLTDKGRYLLEGERLQQRTGSWALQDGAWRPLDGSEGATEWDFLTATAAVFEGQGRAPTWERVRGSHRDEERTRKAAKAVAVVQGHGGTVTRRRRTPASPSGASSTWTAALARVEEADAILLVGLDPRRECALLNTRLRGAYLADVPRAAVGGQRDLTYPVQSLGATGEALGRLQAGEGDFAGVWARASRPLVLRGGERRRRADGGHRRAGVEALVAQTARCGRREAGWTPCRTVPLRSNDRGHRTRDTRLPRTAAYRPGHRAPGLAQRAKVNVRRRFGVTAEERAGAGYTAAERRGLADVVRVFASNGEAWREGASVVTARPSPLATTRERRNREGRRRRRRPLWQEEAGGTGTLGATLWATATRVGESRTGTGTAGARTVSTGRVGRGRGWGRGVPRRVSTVDGRREGAPWAGQSPTLAAASEAALRGESNFRRRPGQ